MASYGYRAFDGDGKSVRGVVVASSPRAAREELIRRGLSPASVRSAASRPFPGRSKVGRLELALALQQLSAMIRAGIPVVQALRALADQVDKESIKSLVSSLADRVSAGESLASACAARPDVFPGEVTGMIRAGERTATLGPVLGRAGDSLEASARLADRTRTALLYPAILAVLGGAFVAFLFLFVAPRIGGLFVGLNRVPPFPIRIILRVSYVLRVGWLPAAIFGLLAIVGWRKVRANEALRAQLDAARLRLPLLGRIIRMGEGARYARALSSLLSGGVRIVEALGIARGSTGNRAIARRLEPVSVAVERGVPLSQALEDAHAFPPLVHHLVRAGEASGELPPLLWHGADILDAAVQERTERISTLIESGLIVVIGLTFLFVALGLLLPIMELNRLPL